MLIVKPDDQGTLMSDYVYVLSMALNKLAFAYLIYFILEFCVTEALASAPE
jgi:hypothetical protein